MANNVNNGITGVIDIPGALRSRGAADGNLVGGVVAYAGDIYDTTASKNQATINSDVSSAISNILSNLFSGDYDDLRNKPTLSSVATSGSISDTTEGLFSITENPSWAKLLIATSRYKSTKPWGVAIGDNSMVYGQDTFCLGNGLKSTLGVAIGRYNTSSDNVVLTLGFGTADDNRKNAITVDVQGNVYLYGVNGYTGGYISSVSSAATHSLTLFANNLDTRLTTLESSSSSSAPTYSAGTGISISNNTISVNTSALNYNQLSNKPIEKDEYGGCAVYCDMGNFASGVDAFAEGYATSADGDYSHAEGYDTISFGESSHSEGKTTKSTGFRSHAEGYLSLAIGHQSHAEGECGYAIGENSHVEGSCLKGRIRVSRDYTSGSTTLYTYDPVETNSLISIYDESTDSMLQQRSMVTNVVALSNGHEYEVTLESSLNRNVSATTTVINHGVAYGKGSHAEGDGTSAIGVGSHTEGHSTVANNAYEHASGTYNVSNPIPQGLSSGGTIFSIGGGSADNSRMNIFEALDNGNVYITGIGNYDGTNALTQGVKSVQQVIEELTLQIAALTNN